jgi:hypothetical protein
MPTLTKPRIPAATSNIELPLHPGPRAAHMHSSIDLRGGCQHDSVCSARHVVRRWKSGSTRGLQTEPAPAAFLESCRGYPGFSIPHLPTRLVHRRMGRAIHRAEDPETRRSRHCVTIIMISCTISPRAPPVIRSDSPNMNHPAVTQRGPWIHFG